MADGTCGGKRTRNKAVTGRVQGPVSAWTAEKKGEKPLQTGRLIFILIFCDVLFLRFGQRVPVQRADDDEHDHEQQQLPVQHLVQAAAPQEQQLGEAPAAGRRYPGLVADRHRGTGGWRTRAGASVGGSREG